MIDVLSALRVLSLLERKKLLDRTRLMGVLSEAQPSLLFILVNQILYILVSLRSLEPFDRAFPKE